MVKTIADSIQALSDQSHGLKHWAEAERAGKRSQTCCYKHC